MTASVMGNRPRDRARAAIAEHPVVTPVPAVEVTVGNRLAILGDPDVAVGWAERLQQTLECVIVATARHDRVPALAAAYPEWAFHAVERVEITGRIGAFALRWRGALGEGTLACDLILDLQPDPHWSGFTLPEGYWAPGSDPLDQALAALALVQAVGEWEKPRYVRLTPSLCAHSRNRVEGCSRCLSACDTQAIRPHGDHVVVDPYWCQGCGDCVRVCPTGALRFQYPRPEEWAETVATALKAWPAGLPCTLLCYDERWQRTLAEREAAGEPLPDHLLPLPIWRAAIFNEELLLYALLRGVNRVAVVAVDERDEEGPRRASEVVCTLLAALGDPHAAERVVVLSGAESEAVWQRLASPLPDWVTPGRFAFRLQPNKSDSLRLIRDALAELAAEQGLGCPVPLPRGAAWGGVTVAEQCTLCFACAGVCPTQALQAGKEEPVLLFTENRCVQCGLCLATCPERAIALEPRWNPTAAAAQPQVVRQSEPAYCAECGVVLGPRSVIDKMVAALQLHPLFTRPEQQALLRLCADCRVKAQFREENPVRVWEL